VSTSPKIIRDLATREFVLTGPDGFEKRFASSDAVGTPESRFVDKSKILSFPATRAVGVIDYTGQPLNDETFVIGGTTYTFKSSATAGVNTEVQIGVDEDTTYASLTAAVNAVDDQASAVHVPASNRVDLTAAVPGTPGNSVTLTDGASNATITAFAGGVNDEWGSRVYAFRRSVNSTAGGVVLPAIGAMVDPGFAYRILDVKLQVNGTVAGATSIDVTHTPNARMASPRARSSGRSRVGTSSPARWRCPIASASPAPPSRSATTATESASRRSDPTSPAPATLTSSSSTRSRTAGSRNGYSPTRG
jgi:hypothetical protein